jgi:hypothetical protein
MGQLDWINWQLTQLDWMSDQLLASLAGGGSGGNSAILPNNALSAREAKLKNPYGRILKFVMMCFGYEHPTVQRSILEGYLNSGFDYNYQAHVTYRTI